MENHEFLPEACYKYAPLSLEDIFNAYVDKLSITVHVEKLMPEKKIVVVRLNDELTAHMPYSEITIYDLHYSEKSSVPIPTNVFTLLGKNIRVKVIKLNGPFITVSRKANMLQAFEHLCKSDKATFYVKSISKKFALGDVGAGIIGRVVIAEICRTHIKSVREYLKKHDVVEVAILARAQNNYFDLSCKQAAKPYNKEDYEIGMRLVGKVCDHLRDAKQPGYYVHISPQVSGIMNARRDQPFFKYGTMVECYVSKASDQGLHLEFVKKL